MQWISNFDGGPKPFLHAAVAVGDRIYSFGGLCKANERTDYTSMNVHVLNTTTFRWTQHPVSDLPYFERNDTLPYKRFIHTAVVYGEKVYIWGGLNRSYSHEYYDPRGKKASTSDDSLFCFDTTSSRWTMPETTGDIPLSRHGHTACIWRQYMYIHGGLEEDNITHAEHIYALDLDKMEWKIIKTQGSGKPILRAFHTAVCLGDHMYVFGGRRISLRTDQKIYSNVLWSLDLLTNKCYYHSVSKSNRPEGRSCHSAFVYEEKMYIYGGNNTTEGGDHSDMYHFDPKTTRWSRVRCEGNKPRERLGQACIVVNNRLFLIGGTRTDRPVFPLFVSKKTGSSIGHCKTYVLDFKPTLKTLCMVAVNQHKLNKSVLPLILRNAMSDMFHPKKTNSEAHSQTAKQTSGRF